MRFNSIESEQEFLSLLISLMNIELGSMPVLPSQDNDLTLMIVELFVQGLDYDEEVIVPRTYCNYIAIQSHMFLMTIKHRAVSMTELCEYLGAPARSIQQGFNTVYGQGVVKYHRSYRMALVRQDLVKNGTRNISLVIKKYGFNHLAHFSKAYKTRYGITPSQEDYTTRLRNAFNTK